MIKTYDDHGRFLLVIEPVDDEAKKLIKKIKELCGLEGAEVKELKGLRDIPAIPEVKPVEAPAPAVPETPTVSDFTPVSINEVSAGLKAYVEACDKIRSGQLSAEEKTDVVAKVKRFADGLKAKTPKGKNLHFIIENMSKVFSQRIQDSVLSEMKLTYDELVRADEDTIIKAYGFAVK